MVEITLNFVGREANEELPPTAIYLIDSTKRIEKKLGSLEGDRQKINLPVEKERLKTIAIGPDVEDTGMLQSENLIQFRAEELAVILKKGTPFEIPRSIWERWLFIRVCLSGNVMRCWPFPFPPWIPCILPPRPCPRPLRCAPICNGVVEIYERECCRPPLIIPNIPDIIKKLRERYYELPEVPGKWPPPPLPEIGITVSPAIITGSAATRKASGVSRRTPLQQALYDDVPETLAQDIQSLETLPQAEAVLYAQKRPYLWPYWCTCRTRKVGEAILQPDGKFHFCYNRLRAISKRNCWTSYYYRVKQWHENQWTYLYDGALKHQFFTSTQYANLLTFFGRTCVGDPPIDPSVKKPYVMLQLIGSTSSYNLKSNWLGKDPAGKDLTQIGDSTLAPLDQNGGLVDGIGDPTHDLVTPAASLSSWLINQPWGGNLSFRLFISSDMQGAGAVYYRIKVIPANATGTPVAGLEPRILADSVAWLKMVQTDSMTKPQIVSESLGPDNSKGEPALFRIPYNADASWLDNQPHQIWYTEGFQNGRYLVTLEIFDKNGKLLDPAGGKFFYLRWLEKTGTDSTAIVPFKGLTHLFWIDNTPCNAVIADLRKDGTASHEECQYFEGISSAQFSSGFYAYHDPESVTPGTPKRSFLWYYTLWTHRGLKGPNVAVETSNIDTPTETSGTPKQSDSLTYGNMLSGLASTKCAFALNLRARAKHTNGSQRLSKYDDADQAAFSIEQTQPGLIFIPPVTPITKPGKTPGLTPIQPNG